MDEVDGPPGVGWGAATRDGAGEQHGSEAAMPQPPSALVGCVQRNEPTASASPDAAASEAFPRWNSLRAQNKKKEERALEMKQKKKLMSRDDVPRPPRAVIPPPAHKGSDVAAPRPNPPAQMPNIFPIPNGDQGSARCSDADFS